MGSPYTNITVVGAGVAGLTAALALSERGGRVTVVERSAALGQNACSRYAAGMLAPWCEGENAAPIVVELGLECLTYWPRVHPHIKTHGSLVVAQRRDAAELNRFARRSCQHEMIGADGVAALDAVRASGTEVVTVSLRRESAGVRAGQAFWQLIRDLGVRVLPNTAGCHSAKEAVTTATMAREVFATNWIKLEVIGDHDTLQPDPFELVQAARLLSQEGFEVFPYTTEDAVVADRLLQAGCRVLMPWGAPIGSGRGLNNPYALRSLRARFPDVPLIIDAGLGLPSHAAQAMELGFDAVLLNTAIAKAGNPVAMAGAFRQAVAGGRAAFEADPMEARDMAAPSTPVFGRAFQ